MSMAAAMEVEEKLKDITDCPICLETFKEPKILPCIHTFCMQCLQKTGDKLNKNPGDMMPCPVCRNEFTVPETGFAGLQKNFFMDKLTEIKNILQPSTGRNLCDVCREVDESLVEAEIPSADMYCTECQQKLCSECFTHHRKYKLTKNHKTVTIKECKSEDIQKTLGLQKDLCEKHLSSFSEIYCSDCQEVVCAICFVEHHKSHEGSYINKVDGEFRKQIEISVDEFSSFLPRLRQAEKQLEIYRTELEHCTEDKQTKINRRRQELKELVDKHADTLLVDIDSTNQENLKKCELHKEEIETLLVSLESYNSYCLRLATVGSASDICRAKAALDARTKELQQLHVSSSTSSSQLSYVSFKITELQDILRSPDQNIVGELNEHQRPTADNSFESSPDNWNQDKKKSTSNTSQRDVSGPTPIQEADEEDNEEYIACMEWNLDDCATTDPIELHCLSELETILKRKLTGVALDESSLHHKLKEAKQSMRSMLETIKTLNSKLENKGVHLCEAEKKRDMLADRNKELELNEDKHSKMVEDLKCQVTLLRDLAYGGGEQEPKTTGGITCDEGVTVSTSLERLSTNARGIEVFGIAILENELFVLSNDNVTVIYDLSTLKFKRRWKVSREGKYDDIKQCNVNKCLYMMKFESQKNKYNEIIRVDPNGNEIAAWSVVKSRGQLSVTRESNILLTVSSTNELYEYAPDGKQLQVICIPWNSGIEKPSHAIKLTSDHYLICHGKDKDVLVRVCVMERAGTVLKYFGELRNRDHLDYPIYLDIDGCGNILVADFIKSRVLLLSSDLTFKRTLTTHQSRCYPKKVCFDKSYGRVFVVEQTKSGDIVSVFNI